MRIVGTSSNGGSQESVLYSNINKGRGGGGKTSFQHWHESTHGGHHQYKNQLHGGGWGNFKGRGSCGGSHQGQQLSSDSIYYYCGKPWHMTKNYYQREHDAQNGKPQ